MANKSGVEFDTHEFDRRINLADKRVRESAKKQLWHNGLDLEKWGKLLAPKSPHGGTLESSGSTERPRDYRAGFEVRVGFNTSYAGRVHETMLPAIAERQMQPGPITRSKPVTRFGPAGGKYLERPMLGMAKEYTKAIARAIKKRLG